MGKVKEKVKTLMPKGELIACVVPADFAITAGKSLIRPIIKRTFKGKLKTEIIVFSLLLPSCCRSVQLGGLRCGLWALPAAHLPLTPALPEERTRTGVYRLQGAAAGLEDQPAICPEGNINPPLVPIKSSDLIIFHLNPHSYLKV